MSSTRKRFNYGRKRWGATPITNLKTDFQGFELKFFLEDVVLRFFPNKIIHLLDSGCGGGNIAGFIKKSFPSWHVYGLDISGDALSIAKKRFGDVTFIHSPAHKIPLENESLDVITSFDSFEHYENLDRVLDEVWNKLKANGFLYVSIPLERQFPSLYWLLYIFGWRGKMHHAGHVNFFNSKDFIQRVEGHGFAIVTFRYSYHFLFSIFDIGYYFLQSFTGDHDYSFETSVGELEPGFKKTILSFFKKAVSVISYYESLLLQHFPGGKGHFVFKKKDVRDFFSEHPPVSVLENEQIRFGLSRFLRPKDYIINSFLKRYRFDQNTTLLDFGCANGIWLERIIRTFGVKGIGVDISPKLIQVADSRKHKIGIYKNTSNTWDIKNGSIDFCISLDVFEHVIDKEKEIERIYAAMKKGGKFLFFTLNPNNKYTFDWLFEIFGSNALAMRSDHKKENYIRPSDFQKLLKKNKFKNISYGLYAGPFNLFFDVSCYAYLAIVEKVLTGIGLRSLLPYILAINSFFVTKITPFNNRFDEFFFKRGYSNGYFIWGEK